MVRLLVVEDSKPDRMFIEYILRKRQDWNLILVHSAEQAKEVLDAVPIDLVLSDIRLPGEDGFALLEEMRETSPPIPVIIMTGAGDEELVVRVLEAGAAAYLPKNTLSARLELTIDKVLRVTRRQQNRRLLLSSLESSQSHFVVKNDPAMLPTIIDRLQSSLEMYRICGANQVMQIGIALEEALANAMYHGNLELKSELKELPGDAFQEEARERLRQEPFCHRKLYVEEIMSLGEARFVIRDEGAGFSQSDLPDPTDLEWLSKPHGRGVMMMRSFMDEVIYNETGNEVTLVKYAPAARTEKVETEELVAVGAE